MEIYDDSNVSEGDIRVLSGIQRDRRYDTRVHIYNEGADATNKEQKRKDKKQK